MASALTEPLFIEKMDKLNSTQQSIENTSSWVCMFRTEARHVVCWYEAYFAKADQKKRLCMIYLANDILQVSRKRGPEFVQEFFKVLPRALQHFLAKADEKSKIAVNKVIRTLEERRVFGSSSKSLKQLIDTAEVPLTTPSGRGAKSASQKPTSPPPQAPHMPEALVAAARALAGANAAAWRASQLASSLNVARETLSSAAAAPEQITGAMAMLRNHKTALEQESQARTVASQELQRASEVQAAAAATATNESQKCDEQLAALEARASEASSRGASAAAASAVYPANIALGGAMPPTNVEDPHALWQALSSLPGGAPTAVGPGAAAGAGVPIPTTAAVAVAVEDEYDPEEYDPTM